MSNQLDEDYKAFRLVGKRPLTTDEFNTLCAVMFSYLLGERVPSRSGQYLNLEKNGQLIFNAKTMYVEAEKRPLDIRVVKDFIADPKIGYSEKLKGGFYLVSNADFSENACNYAARMGICLFSGQLLYIFMDRAIEKFNAVVKRANREFETALDVFEHPDYVPRAAKKDNALTMEEIDFFESDIFDDK